MVVAVPTTHIEIGKGKNVGEEKSEAEEKPFRSFLFFFGSRHACTVASTELSTSSSLQQQSQLLLQTQ